MRLGVDLCIILFAQLSKVTWFQRAVGTVESKIISNFAKEIIPSIRNSLPEN